MPAQHTIHLIDASPYVFRAWHSLPDSLRDRAGRPVNAVYGFAGFLLRYIAEERPTHLGVAFDGSLTTSFRNERYPAYKAQRALPPPELEAQLADCRELAAALGLASYVDGRYEADDLIATLTAQLLARSARVVVVSSDKDLAQLVGEDVQLYDFARGERRDAAAVRAHLGVEPAQVPDFLGLAGDAVDGIPGVAGIGAKSAELLLARFAHLEDLYADLERVAALDLRGARALARKLAAGREMAFLSRELATVARDAPCRARLGELRYAGADPELVTPLFERLGFGRLRERIPCWKKR